MYVGSWLVSLLPIRGGLFVPVVLEDKLQMKMMKRSSRYLKTECGEEREAQQPGGHRLSSDVTSSRNAPYATGRAADRTPAHYQSTLNKNTSR